MLTAEKSINPNPARALYENFMTGEYGKKWDDLPAGVQKRWADALAAGVIAMTSVRIEPVEDFDTEALRAASFQPGTIAVLPEPTDIIFSDGEPYAAMTVDYLGCEYLSRDVESIEKIAAAGSKGPTEVIYLFRGTRSKSLWPKQSASIKALEWRTFCSRSGNCAAQSPVGEYVIQNEDDLWLVYLPYQDQRWGKGHSTIEEAKAAAQVDYEARICSALSAQAQDVATPKEITEAKAEPDRSKFPYVWEGPKPDEAIIHSVINAYMGAQDREYDIDQFRYYKANWRFHYTLNQHMKAAIDAAEPAKQEGGE